MRFGDIVPLLSGLVTVALWSGSFLAIRDAVARIEPVELAAARFLLAGLAGLLWLTLAGRTRPGREDIARIALCGLIGIALYNVLLGLGEQHVSAGVAAFAVGTQTLFAALASYWLDGERPTRRFILGFVISIGGLALITSQAAITGSVKGVALCVAAAFLSGTYFVIQRPLVAKLGPISAAASTMVAGGAMLLPWATPAVERVMQEPALVAPVLYLALLASVVAYSFWMVAISGLGAARSAQVLFLMAPTAAVLEWSLGWTPFNIVVALGGIVAVTGVVIASKAPPDATLVKPHSPHRSHRSEPAEGQSRLRTTLPE